MFEQEIDLIKSFKDKAENFLYDGSSASSSCYFLMEEFDSQHGIADLVIGTYRNCDVKLFDRKSVNINWVRPLIDFSEEEYINAKYFMRRYGVSVSTAKARLKEYEDAGFLFRDDSGYLRLGRQYEPITEIVIAIEAKLRHWKKALQQAVRYKRFSNLSYVLLDHQYIKPALKNIDLFKDKNIGLVSLDCENYKIHYQPTAIEVPQGHSFFRLNEAAVAQFNHQLPAAFS